MGNSTPNSDANVSIGERVPEVSKIHLANEAVDSKTVAGFKHQNANFKFHVLLRRRCSKQIMNRCISDLVSIHKKNLPVEDFLFLGCESKNTLHV
jgi:hypothetical protein